jgi:predicted Zn-dependent protease
MKIVDTIPAHIRNSIGQGRSAFSKRKRFDTNYSNKVLRAMPLKGKRQHLRDSVYNALAQVAREEGGQPPWVERFREATIIVEWLESQGVPFGVCPKSRMNKALHQWLTKQSGQSNDHRKSRRKKIKAAAVQDLLRKIRQLRACDPLVHIRPYTD